MDGFRFITRQTAAELYFLVLFQFVKEQYGKGIDQFYNRFESFTSSYDPMFQKMTISNFETPNQLKVLNKEFGGGKFSLFATTFFSQEVIKIFDRDVIYYLEYITDDDKLYSMAVKEYQKHVRKELLGKTPAVKKTAQSYKKKFYNSNNEIIIFIKHLNFIKTVKPGWDICDSQYRLENSYYWLYYYDQLPSAKMENMRFEEYSGISKALLYFGNYGHASIINYDLKTSEYEHYHGVFEVKNSKHLYLKMNISPNFEKDLSMLLYIGNKNEKVSIAAGQFHNVDFEEKIYSGTLVIRHLDNNSMNINNLIKTVKNSKINCSLSGIGFYNKVHDDMPDDITDELKTFLSDEHSNYLAIPNIYISEDKHLRKLRKK